MNKHYPLESFSFPRFFILVIMLNVVQPMILVSAAAQNPNEQIRTGSVACMHINSYEVDLNLTVNVSVVITHAENIAGGSIKINFDTSIVVVEDIIKGDFGTPVANINNQEGVAYIASALATNVGQINATLAFVEFRGVSEGFSNLHIETVELNDETGTIIVPAVINHGSIHVIQECARVCGDINGDRVVDDSDAIIIAAAFGSNPGGHNWDPIADLVQDGTIDIFDVVFLAQNFGKTART